MAQELSFVADVPFVELARVVGVQIELDPACTVEVLDAVLRRTPPGTPTFAQYVLLRELLVARRRAVVAESENRQLKAAITAQRSRIERSLTAIREVRDEVAERGRRLARVAERIRSMGL